MNGILIHDYTNSRWIDLYPQDDTVDDSDLKLLCFSHHICIIEQCDEEYNFWPTNITLSPAEEKWLEEEVVEKGCNPKFYHVMAYSKCEDGLQEEVSQKPSDDAAIGYVQIQVNL